MSSIVLNTSFLPYNCHFLALWGLDQEGNFHRSTVFTPQDLRWYQVEDRSDILLSRDIQACRELTKEELFVLESSAHKNSSNNEKIARIMYLLQRDLLGSPIASMILDKKSIRDCFHRDSLAFPAYNAHITGDTTVSKRTKALFGTFIFLLLVVMVAYILFFAIYFPASPLQRAWLYSLYAFLVFDCVLISTTEVLVTHVLIPYTIKADLKVVRELMASTIQMYNQTAHNAAPVRAFAGRPVNTRMIKSMQNQLSEGDDEVPNISEFFFVSARLAQYFSELPESRLALTYATMLPPGALFPSSSWWRPLNMSLQDLDVKDISGVADVDGHGPDLRQRDFRSIFSFHSLKLYFTDLFRRYMFSSVATQDLILQVMLVIVFAIVVLVTYRLFLIMPFLVFTPIVLVLVLYVLWKVCKVLYRQCMRLYSTYKVMSARAEQARQNEAAAAQQTPSSAAGVHNLHPHHAPHSAAKQSKASTGAPVQKEPSVHTAVIAVKPANSAILEHQRRMLVNSSALKRSRIAASVAPTDHVPTVDTRHSEAIHRVEHGSQYTPSLTQPPVHSAVPHSKSIDSVPHHHHTVRQVDILTLESMEEGLQYDSKSDDSSESSTSSEDEPGNISAGTD